MLCIHVPSQALVETKVDSTQKDKNEIAERENRRWCRREYSQRSNEFHDAKNAIKPRAQINYFPEERSFWFLYVVAGGTAKFQANTHIYDCFWKML